MYNFSCNDIFDDCDWYNSSEDIDELFEEIKKHLIQDHGITKFSKDLIKNIEESIFDDEEEEDEDDFDLDDEEEIDL